MDLEMNFPCGSAPAKRSEVSSFYTRISIDINILSVFYGVHRVIGLK